MGPAPGRVSSTIRAPPKSSAANRSLLSTEITSPSNTPRQRWARTESRGAAVHRQQGLIPAHAAGLSTRHDDGDGFHRQGLLFPKGTDGVMAFRAARAEAAVAQGLQLPAGDGHPCGDAGEHQVKNGRSTHFQPNPVLLRTRYLAFLWTAL